MKRLVEMKLGNMPESDRLEREKRLEREDEIRDKCKYQWIQRISFE